MTQSSQKKDIELMDIWRIALKKRWLIITVAVAFLIIAGIHTFLKTPHYRATASILIEEPKSEFESVPRQ